MPLTPASGTPYLVSGTVSNGAWQSFTLTFKDESKWTFTPAPTGSNYVLTQIANIVGRSILLNYDGRDRLVSVTDDGALQTPPLAVNTLLTLSYTGNQSTLSNVTEYSDPANPRQILYTSSAFADGTPFLYSVSQIGLVGTAPPTLWQYTYSELYGEPFLTQVGILDPTGATNNMLTNTISYDANGRVMQIADANNNLRTYYYLNTTYTQVQVSKNNAVVASWISNFDTRGRNTGVTDILMHSEDIAYGDANNPYQPTSYTNRNGQTVTFTYDTLGNVDTTVASVAGATLRPSTGTTTDTSRADV